MMLIHSGKKTKKGGGLMAEATGSIAEKGADAFFDVLKIAVAIGVSAVGSGYVLGIIFGAL